MSVTTAIKTNTPTLVGMGETVFLKQDESARAVVGSCVGLILYHRRRKLAAVAHIVLPESAGRAGSPGKFADTAVPHMLATLEKDGAHRGGLVAKLTGGAEMFGGSSGPLQIGDANILAVTTILDEMGVQVSGKCVGGTKGRKFSFCCDTGHLIIEVAGQVPFVL